MITWLKLIHILTISIWAAGLVSLPGLYVQRAHVADNDQLYRLQRMVRFAFVKIVSPAAFIAVASGIGLIFLRDVFVPWFSLKLALVASLVIVHVLTGLIIIRLFNRGEIYPVWRFIAVTIVTVALILAVLYVVLAKPMLDLDHLLPDVLAEPGGLKRLFENVNPWRRP